MKMLLRMKAPFFYSSSLCLLLLTVPSLGDGLESQHNSTLPKIDEPALSQPSEAVTLPGSEDLFAYKPGAGISPVLQKCHDEVVHLCDELAHELERRVADPNEPCPYKWMPFKRCEVNSCLVFHSNLEEMRTVYPEFQAWLPESTDISDECKDAVQGILGMQELMRIYDKGPQNWSERLLLWQIDANFQSLLWHEISTIICAVSMAIMFATLIYRHCWRKKETPWKEERRVVLEAIANSETHRERLETLTGERLDPTPFELKWNIEGQVEQLSKLKNQAKLLRAIYSSPDLKRQIQEDLLADSEVTLGFTPPLDRQTLVTVFDKPRTFLQRWLPIVDVGLLVIMTMEPFGELLPWQAGLISLYIAWHMVLRNAYIVVFRNKHLRKSTCCVCGTTSVQASISSKKTDDMVGRCACCSGTGVCFLACEICNSRLEKKFPRMEVPPQPPQGGPMAAQQPLPKHHSRLLL